MYSSGNPRAFNASRVARTASSGKNASRVPIQIVQGDQDQYGTLKQIEAAEQECYCPVEAAVLPGIRHVPYREAPELTLKTIADFINRLLRGHHEDEARQIPGLAAG